ncbi:NirD/YgiW/YdeI family stress tolerance protein [Chlorobium sp. N1]|uniref:YgiW/YdeI family stress tolerance OB fold protein n=1 Tax=Chlorobium sp. N1 TaxID=2491138 RepID=UPI0013F16315|nr:NirD/YgiW/YdeI family stress tolerance protein [Chlorobium sp. N1]
MMKKTTLLALIGSSMLFSSTGFAAYRGPEAGAPQDKSLRPQRAAAIGNMADDTKVVLEGRIVNHRRGDCYTFRDRSGETLLEISRKAWKGLDVDDRTIVRVFGKTERRGRMSCVEARRIEPAGKAPGYNGPGIRPEIRRDGPGTRR